MRKEWKNARMWKAKNSTHVRSDLRIENSEPARRDDHSKSGAQCDQNKCEIMRRFEWYDTNLATLRTRVNN